MRRPILFTFKGDSRGLAAAGQQAQRALQGVTNELQQTDRVADRLDGKNISLDVDAKGLLGLRAKLQAQLATLENVDITPDMDPLKVLRQIRQINAAIRTIDNRVEVDVDVDRDRIRRGLGAFAGSLAGELTPGFTRSFTGAMGSGLTAAGASPPGAAVAAIGAAIGSQIALAATPFLVNGLFAAAAIPAAKLGIGLLEQFDALDKAQRKANIVFGKNVEEVRRWADELSYGVGLGREQITAIAAGVQDLLVPKGFSRGTATDITQLIVERGAAIAEFQGVEAQEGIDAVTSALLGQTRTLKSYGVEISTTLIKERQGLIENRGYWIDYGKDGVRSSDDVKRSVAGLTEEQLKTVAALELIQSRSTDAWRAFQQGASTADDVLDAFAALKENLKTDAIEGFGGILVDVLNDIRAVADIKIGFDDGGLRAWIDNNRGAIIDAFYAIGQAVLSGVDTMILFAQIGIRSVGPILSLTSAVLGFGEAWTYAAQGMALMTGQVQLLKPLSDLRGYMQGTKADVDELRDAWGDSGEKGAAELDKWRDKVAGVKDALRDAQKVSKLKFELEADLKDGSVTKVEDRLSNLSKKRLADIIATTKGSDDKVDKRLNRLAKKEREARIKAKNYGVDASDKELNDLARKRLAEIGVKVSNKDAVEEFMRRLLAPATKTISIVTENLPSLGGGNNGGNGEGPGGYGGSVVIRMQDGRLADFIDASVGGHDASVRRTYVRRFGEL